MINIRRRKKAEREKKYIRNADYQADAISRGKREGRKKQMCVDR